MRKVAVAWLEAIGAGASYLAAVVEYRALSREYEKKYGKLSAVDAKLKGKPELHVVKE